MSSEPRQPIQLTTSAWFDLVYHTLALLPTRASDASRLHDDGYVAWTQAHLPAELRALRTLPEDAPRLAALADAAPQAYVLQSFVHLHHDVPHFLATAALPFAEVPWPDRAQQALARLVSQAVPLELIELLRIALWAEVRGGYPHLRERVLLPDLDARLQTLRQGLDLAAPSLPGLDAVRWVACHPLRRAGRLLDDGKAAPTIAIGLPDAELDVAPLAPVLQGCHEFVLSLVNRHLGPLPGANPRAGTPGHALHVQRETLALCAGARLLDVPKLRAAQGHWLARIYPHRPAGLVRAWLASGAALPDGQRPVYEDIAAAIEASRRSAT